MFQGYLCVGGNQIGNNARARALAEAQDCPPSWFVGEECEGLADALGDNLAEYADITQAPWYDPADPATSRFYGAYITSLGDVSSSTRQGEFTEGILDGGVPGLSRHAGKSFRVRAWLTAAGEDALESGHRWLDAMLQSSDCGTHAGGACGAVDMSLFTGCPPARGTVTEYGPWREAARNLIPNPSFEAEGSEVKVYENLFTNPSFEAGAGEVTVYENLFTNPSFETTGGTVEVRRNLYPDPRFSTGNTVALYSSSTKSVSNGVLTITRGTSGAGLTAMLYSVPHGANLPASARVQVRKKPGTPDGRLVAVSLVSYAGGSGAAWGTNGSGAVNLTLTDQWQDAVLTGYVSSATATALGVQFGAQGTWEVGDGYEVRYPLVEASMVVGPYFDGAYSPDPDLTASWTGAANASASILTGVSVSGMFTQPAQTVDYQTTLSDGTKALKSVMQTDGAKGVNLNGMATIASSTTYTMLLRVRASQTGAVTLRVSGANVSGFTLTEEWQDLRITVTTGTLAGNTGILITPGSAFPTGEWIEISEAGLFAGEYTGPWFSGDSPPKLRRNLALNPGPRTPTGWGGIGSTHDFSSGHLIATVSSDATGALLPRSQVIGNYASVPVSPGAPYYLRVEVKHSRGLTMQLRPWFITADGTYVTWHAASPVADTADWTYMEAVGTVPATAAYMGYQVGVLSNLSPSLVGDTYEIRHVTTDPGDYFDGSTEQAPGYASAWEGAADASASYVYDADFTTSWTGAPNASTSKVTGKAVAPMGNSDSGAAYAKRIASARWSSSGNSSLRIIPTKGNTTYAICPLSGFTVGKRYTILATARLAEPQTGPLGTNARSLYTGWEPNNRAIAPNEAGVHQLRQTVTATSVGLSLVLYNGSGTQDIWWDNVAIIEGEYTGPWFSGDSPSDDPDLEYVWTGAPNESTSALVGEGVSDVASQGPSVALRSSRWSANGGYSVRLMRTGAGSSVAQVGTTISPPSGSATFQATVWSDADLPVPQFPGASPGWALAGSAGGIGAMASSPLSAGVPSAGRVTRESSLVALYLLPPDEVGASVWYDAVGVYDGDYAGPWFDGDTYPDLLELDRRTSWLGEPHVSISTLEVREITERDETDEEYDTHLLSYVRNLHDVTCISGPLEVQTRQSSDGVHWGRLVEFTLYAGKPFFYGATKTIDFNPTPALVIQDFPFNLAVPPSAELAGSAITAATNYSTNPSVEVDAAGWTTGAGGGVATANVTSGRVTGEIAAVGTASFRSVFTAPAASSTAGNFRNLQVVDISARPAGAAISVNVWGSSFVAAGAPVRDRIAVELHWRDSAGGTPYGQINLGEIGLSGGNVSVRGITPPAGATHAEVRVVMFLSSWNAGSVVRLYTDALAVTVP